MIPFLNSSEQQTRRQRRCAWIANHRRRAQDGPNRASDSETLGRPAVHVDIQKLQLRGFVAIDRAAIGRALEVELTRLIVQKGLSDAYRRPGFLDCLRAGTFQLAKAHRSSTIGVQIARSIYRGIENGGKL